MRDRREQRTAMGARIVERVELPVAPQRDCHRLPGDRIRQKIAGFLQFAQVSDELPCFREDVCEFPFIDPLVRIHLAIDRGELFNPTLVLLNLAEEIEADQLDDREALLLFTTLLNELFEAARNEQPINSEDPGEKG